MSTFICKSCGNKNTAFVDEIIICETCGSSYSAKGLIPLEKIDQIISSIAKKEGITPEEVRTQMKLAMISGILNSDNEMKERWGSIPSEDELPTPEEFLFWAINKVAQN